MLLGFAPRRSALGWPARGRNQTRCRSAASTRRKATVSAQSARPLLCPLKRLSTKRLLIVRYAQSSKHSQRYVLVEAGLPMPRTPPRAAGVTAAIGLTSRAVRGAIAKAKTNRVRPCWPTSGRRSLPRQDASAWRPLRKPFRPDRGHTSVRWSLVCETGRAGCGRRLFHLRARVAAPATPLRGVRRRCLARKEQESQARRCGGATGALTPPPPEFPRRPGVRRCRVRFQAGPVR